MTAMVKHAATKTNTAWKQCATTLHFWIYDCGIRILWYVWGVGVESYYKRLSLVLSPSPLLEEGEEARL